MPTGLGLVPFGTTPFGLSISDSAPVPPDPPTDARFIDPRTRDYVLAADTELERMPPTRQRVYLALVTRQGSSSVLRKLGTKLPDTIDGAFEQRVRNEIRRALDQMIQEGALSLDGVRITQDITGRSVVNVLFTDLATNESDSLAL